MCVPRSIALLHSPHLVALNVVVVVSVVVFVVLIVLAIVFVFVVDSVAERRVASDE